MGTVNIFLGGTGKHIAEDIQDSRDFYKRQISEPIAFALDLERRPGVELRGFVHPSQNSIEGVEEIAGNWLAHEPGRLLGPARDNDTPGAQLSPEHSILKDIGKGIAENPAPSAGLFALRGHGLTVFSSLFDPALAIAGAGDGNRLRTLISQRIREEVGTDGDLRINLVTSTAGGTGAGTVIPLALWLRSEAGFPPFTLNLLAVTPTAFDSVLRGDPTLLERRAKGLSGTYAMFRELPFFQDVDPQNWFSPRSLPIASRGLDYTPGGELFDRVYWFGSRDGNDPRDAFEEAGTLLRVLSSDQSTAGQIDGATGSHPLQTVGAITAIEYPKLLSSGSSCPASSSLHMTGLGKPATHSWITPLPRG